MNQQGMYCVYIITNWSHRVMYIGITSNLPNRIQQHKNKIIAGFTQKYNVHKLVYFESTRDVHIALSREKQLKGWSRIKKNKLVVTLNPDWKDLGIEL